MSFKAYGATTTVRVCNTPLLIGCKGCSCFPALTYILRRKGVRIYRGTRPLHAACPRSFLRRFGLRVNSRLSLRSIDCDSVIERVLSFIGQYTRVRGGSRRVGRIILAVPTVCARGSVQGAIVHDTTGTTNFRAVRFLSRPITTTRRCTSVVKGGGSKLAIVCSLNNKAFSPALLSVAAPTSCGVLNDRIKIGYNKRFFSGTLCRRVTARYGGSKAPLLERGQLRSCTTYGQVGRTLSVRAATSRLFSGNGRVDVAHSYFGRLVRPRVRLALGSLSGLVTATGGG